MNDIIPTDNNTIIGFPPFALLEFDVFLSMIQQKLYYMAMAKVQKGEDPEAQVMYRLDIALMSKLSGTPVRSTKRSLLKVIPQLAEMNVKLRTSYVENDNLHMLFNIFQEISIDLHDTNVINVRFNYEFRKQILKMKKEHDIEYSAITIMGLKSRYSISIYTYLITEASLIKSRRGINDEDAYNDNYKITVTKEKLFSRLNYNATVADFNRRILPEIIEELNEYSELYVSKYNILRQGRTIEGYNFYFQYPNHHPKLHP